MNFGVSACAAFEPPPSDARFTAGEVFCYFMLPAALIGATSLAAFTGLYSWLQLRKHLAPQAVRLRDTGLTLASPDGTATDPVDNVHAP